jgi:hypothetical protein
LPAALDARFICPVLGLIDKPPGKELNSPFPLETGVGFVEPLLQNTEPGYVKLTTGVVVILTICVYVAVHVPVNV